MRERMTVEEAARVLGVPADAELPEVHRAYRQLARELHPDLRPEATAAERSAAAERFDEVTRARRLLTERRPVIPIRLERRRPSKLAIPEGIGGSLTLVTVLVFVLLAVVSLTQAFAVPGRSAPVQHPSVVATTP